MISLVLAATLAGVPATLPDRLATAAKKYYGAMVALSHLTGRDVAYDYYQRLLDDASYIAEPQIPLGYDAASYGNLVTAMSSLDLELVDRLERADYGNVATARGLHEVLIRSSVDGTMQPAAIYVPRGYDFKKPAPLVVFLHGHTQTESSLLAPAYVGALADQTGSVVVAPYGRAYYDFSGAAASDVYDAVGAVSSQLSIDPKQRFLAGYSMGGFSLFTVAPERPQMWRAMLCISGGAMGHDLPRALQRLKNVPLYVVTGTADDSIPTEYTQRTAHYLANNGFIVSLYVHPGGTHRIATNVAQLQRAWDDMHAGVFREIHPDYLWSMPVGAPSASVKN